MGKTNKKTRIADLQDLSKLKKEEMHEVVGGREKETKNKKSTWKFFRGILNQ